MKKYLVIFFLISALSGCKTWNRSFEAALQTITADDMKKHISVLASDEFLGRAPSTEGETKTISYLAEQFRQIGLQPAARGSYFQEVPLVKLTADHDMKLVITGGKNMVRLKYSDDFIGNTPQRKDHIRIDNSDMIFVGYGINSTEYGWNDYEGLDVKGKTVVLLINDPGYVTSDSSLFNGRAMTYYGRWTYKYEEAARQGAEAVIIIHETGAAAYPWGVVQNSWSGPEFCLEDDELASSGLQFKGWITNESARKIFGSAGLDFDRLTKSASTRGFKPVDMKLKLSLELRNRTEYTRSNNVAAVWPGSRRPDEYIIYTAHWDHFGVNNAFKGDSILNGAVDNATGTASLLVMAKAFTLLHPVQDRSVLFLSVTCEEQGLLGSDYYARNPLFPPGKTIGVINIDGLNIFGRTKDMNITGYGFSGLDDYAIAVLGKYGRYATPDPTPEKGSYFRSDHFSFAKVGIPSLNLSSGVDNVEHGREWGLAQNEKWTMDNYHKPSDNYEPDKWDFSGMIEDTRVYFEIGYDLSNTDDFPEWKPGIPYKSLRDMMMQKQN
ncbi:MAG TPA: M28 family metallopeptidase [Bacteroidales bacterium]|nr:M28 family metallopeptidase [Bacteroidales bacterium]